MIIYLQLVICKHLLEMLLFTIKILKSLKLNLVQKLIMTLSQSIDKRKSFYLFWIIRQWLIQYQKEGKILIFYLELKCFQKKELF